MDTFPDLGSLADQELKDLIKQLTDEEMDISYQRRILHGKIDILRAELVNRLRKKHEGGEDVISGADVQQLTDILAGRVPAGGRRVAGPDHGGPALSRVRFRQRRRRQLLPALRRVPRPVRAAPPGATTATYKVGETGEIEAVELEDVVARGAALVIRAGGGRAGESFAVERRSAHRRAPSRQRHLPRRRHRLPRSRDPRPPRQRATTSTTAAR